jgi:hypothetical protein
MSPSLPTNGVHLNNAYEIVEGPSVQVTQERVPYVVVVHGIQSKRILHLTAATCNVFPHRKEKKNIGIDSYKD